MKNPLNYPKQEDVTEIDIGSHKLSIVKLTDENRQYAAEVTLSMYLGEHCKYCDKKIATMEELKTVVYAGYHDRGRIACKSCWEENNHDRETS